MTVTDTDRHALRVPIESGATIDPFALAGPHGIVFHSGTSVRVGLGVAFTVDLPSGLDSPDEVTAAGDALASVAVEDRMDRGRLPDGDDGRGGVLGFGALPFDRSAPATLVVPEVLYGSDGVGSDGVGSEWVTVIGSPPVRIPTDPAGLRSWLLERAAKAPVDRAGPGTRPPLVIPRSSDDDFRSMVTRALRAIDHGDLSKVVLARQVDVTMGRAVDIVDLLRRWQGLEPTCTVFSVPTSEGQFVGASPELLVDRDGPRVHCRPLAGTTGRAADAQIGRLPGGLLGSVKDGNEHRLVVEAIEAALAPLSAMLQVPTHPGLVHLHNITHLGTDIVATLAERPDGTVPTALDLVAALHPTPAVGGVPAAPARALIEALEPVDRGHYAGPVGYLDGGGNGTWMLGIRSVSVRGASARLAAGVGIVEGSDPESELAETNLKLKAAFDALAPGTAFSTGSTGSTRHEAVG